MRWVTPMAQRQHTPKGGNSLDTIRSDPDAVLVAFLQKMHQDIRKLSDPQFLLYVADVLQLHQEADIAIKHICAKGGCPEKYCDRTFGGLRCNNKPFNRLQWKKQYIRQSEQISARLTQLGAKINPHRSWFSREQVWDTDS